MRLEEFKGAIRDARNAVSDLTAEINEVISEGYQTAYSGALRRTHGATKKEVEYTAITIIQFTDGRIVRDQYQSGSPSTEEQIA